MDDERGFARRVRPLAQRATHRWGRWVGCWALSLMVAALLVPMVSLAQAPGSLPPRHKPTPATTSDRRLGGYIRLAPRGAAGDAGAPAGAWSVVQWQDGAGVWHDVEGWCGAVDDVDRPTKTWWVHPVDLGRGPFRWVVLEGPGGAVLGASASFVLPDDSREVTEVGVTLS